jgi:hypothetical protein
MKGYTMPQPRPISRISFLMLSVALTALLLRGWALWPQRARSVFPSIPGMTLIEVGPRLSTGLSMNARQPDLPPDMPRSGPFYIEAERNKDLPEDQGQVLARRKPLLLNRSVGAKDKRFAERM